mgnify:CR=1 FL=1
MFPSVDLMVVMVAVVAVLLLWQIQVLPACVYLSEGGFTGPVMVGMVGVARGTAGRGRI